MQDRMGGGEYPYWGTAIMMLFFKKNDRGLRVDVGEKTNSKKVL
jgi:hypothetical protein